MKILKKDSASGISNNKSSDSAKTSRTINVSNMGFLTVKECPLCKGKNGCIEDIHSTAPFCNVCLEKLREAIGLEL
jgi:hypothetical protein